MTSTAWIQGASNFLICGLIVVSGGLLLGGLISSFFGSYPKSVISVRLAAAAERSSDR
jgi:hypothetical protein